MPGSGPSIGKLHSRIWFSSTLTCIGSIVPCAHVRRCKSQQAYDLPSHSRGSAIGLARKPRWAHSVKARITCYQEYIRTRVGNSRYQEYIRTRVGNSRSFCYECCHGRIRSSSSTDAQRHSLFKTEKRLCTQALNPTMNTARSLTEAPSFCTGKVQA